MFRWRDVVVTDMLISEIQFHGEYGKGDADEVKRRWHLVTWIVALQNFGPFFADSGEFGMGIGSNALYRSFISGDVLVSG